MNDQIKRDALRKYFETALQYKYAAIALIVLGILIWGAFSDTPEGESYIGILFIIGGGFWLYKLRSKTGNVPGDAEVDAWFQEDIARIVEQSYQKTGLDKSELVKEPIPITGPILWGTNGISAKDLRWKKGKDGIVRFAINRVTVIHLSNQLLAAYACDYNSLKNVALNESTQEYHYKDVVSVTTQEDSTSYTLPNGVSFVNSQAFRLSVTSGESIKVIIGAAKISEITGGTIPTTSAEKAVQVIRTMLREKKQ